MKNITKFFKNALTLTLTSLFMRGVGVSFNVYISNKVGAEAIGLYSLISSVYGFALTLATSGIALAVTRMVAEALGKENDRLVRASMKKCMAYALFFGTLSSVLLFSLSEVIGTSWLDDIRTVRPLRLMSLTLPLIALCSAMNGYFTAVRRVSKNAFSQLFEQAVKICVTVGLLTAILPDGIEYACIALVLGGAASELFSFAVMLIIYICDKRKYITDKGSSVSGSSVTKRLLKIALPVAFSTYARSGLLTIEHALIPAGLRKNGSSREHSLAVYGTLTAMVMPVILFPSALISSFAGMTIPELAEGMARGHKKHIKYICERVFQLSLIFSIGVSGILICFSGELGQVIYSSDEASLYIKLVAPLIPVMYLDSTTDAMLKGLGEQFYSMNVNIIDALISVILVYLLLPVYGINGYIFIIFLMEILNFGLSASRLMSKTGLRPRLFKWVIKPLFCAVLSCTVSYLIFSYVPSHGAFALALHIFVCLMLYIIMLMITKTLDREDSRWIASIFKKDQ